MTWYTSSAAILIRSLLVASLIVPILASTVGLSSISAAPRDIVDEPAVPDGLSRHYNPHRP